MPGSEPLEAFDEERVSEELDSLKEQLRQRDAELGALRAEVELKEERIAALTIRDPLSGLYTHAYFQERLDREIERSARHGHEFSVACVDVDHFRALNREFGLAAGDRVIKTVAQVLLDEGRRTDLACQFGESGVIARFGGDEFMVILPETPKEGAIVVAERLRRTVEHLSTGAPGFTCSIGVSGYPGDAVQREAVIEAAEAAMTAAKRRGRNAVVPFEEGIGPRESAVPTSAEIRRAELARILESSLDDLSFDTAFQPIVRSDTGKIVAYEALARPHAFSSVDLLLETAAKAGQIVELGRALRKVMARSLQALPEDTLLFVNLHPQELNDPQLLVNEEDLKGLAGRLVLEVTETAAIKDMARARAALARMRQSGYRVALDDLGSGYASLNSLAAIEPEFVKLDMEMLRGIKTDSRSARLIKHILEYAEGEGILAVGEGIETAEEREVVGGMGCPLLQGFHFARPGPSFFDPETVLPLSDR